MDTSDIVFVSLAIIMSLLVILSPLFLPTEEEQKKIDAKSKAKADAIRKKYNLKDKTKDEKGCAAPNNIRQQQQDITGAGGAMFM
jgi:hypothetical protein